MTDGTETEQAGRASRGASELNAGSTSWSILQLRGGPTILDVELAELFGVEVQCLVQQTRRKASRFGPGYLFQLNLGEMRKLANRRKDSGSAASAKLADISRRQRLWAFTELGVVMAAVMLDSDQVATATRLILEAFAAFRRPVRQPGRPRLGVEMASSIAHLGRPTPRELLAHQPAPPKPDSLRSIAPRLRRALDHLLDTVIDPVEQRTARVEMQRLITESISHLHARLKRQGAENDRTCAEAAKLLAQAEKERTIAAKKRAEIDAIKFAATVKRLRLLIKVEEALSAGSHDALLDVLKEFDGT
jgi:hypothetical protein